MSNFKFKEGDLVEVIRSSKGNKGHRFVIGNFKIIKWVNKNIPNYERISNSYESDLIFKGGESEFMWSSEDQLKLVNPDIDDTSEMTFSEIMDEITEAITVEQ